MKTVLALNNQFPTEENKKYGLVSGVSYYRQVMPGRFLSPDYHFDHLGHKLVDLPANTAETEVAKLVKGHDIVFTKHLDNPSGIYMLLGACDYYNRPLVVDFDDDVFASDGKEHTRYVYPKGSDAEYYVKTLIKEATAITVSTEPLLEVYGVYNPNVFLCPNGVDLKDWENIKRKKHERLTIGWPASTGHIVDHGLIEPVMKAIVAGNPDVVFAVLGHYTPEMLSFLPRKNWEIKPAIPWWEGHPHDERTYPKILADLGSDIGLAPISDSRYNAARSLAKWFEYTMTGTPVVASSYGPYTALRHEEDALLAKDEDAWISNILRLINDPHERDRINASARARIEREYTAESFTPDWRKVFSSFTGFHK